MSRHTQYWQERSERLHGDLFRNTDAYIQSLTDAIDRAQGELSKEIYMWLERVAANNQLSILKAKKILNNKELQEFRWTLEEYIKKGSGKLTPEIVKQLENASALSHISRLQAMQNTIQAQGEVLYAQIGLSARDYLKDLYTQGYGKMLFEISSLVSPDKTFAKPNEKILRELLDRPWAPDGRNFSSRIWSHKELLINELQKNLTHRVLKGEAPDRSILALSKTFQVAKSRAANLIQTEAAYFTAKATQESYKELNVQKYEVVATLDSKTSRICQVLDGKKFDLSMYRPGVTAPPFHARCRTHTVPVVEEAESELDKRAARDKEGRVYYVQGDISYPAWAAGHYR